MFAICKRLGNIGRQQQKLRIALDTVRAWKYRRSAYLHRGFQSLPIDACLKIGAQTGFRNFLFLRRHLFNHKRLA